ncbi:tetratricopeptide repeat protein 1 [Ceratobasidium sp. AG-Ba]|nr:tetratricopeptide repeat protein 1 [Ceratobasidium sp. AG-Ba]
MPAIEELSSDTLDLAEKTQKLALGSEGARDDSGDESEDEFHDACDRMAGPGSNDVEEFTEAEILELIESAEASKAEGNKLYVKDEWEAAKECYAHGLTRVPKRKPTRAPPPPPTRENEGETSQDEGSDHKEEAPKDDSPPPTELEVRAASLRAQLNCNIGACLVKMNDHEGAVKACTEALIDDPKYVKALQRRATSNEIVGSWSALSSAESDYNTLLTLLPPSSHPPIQRSLARLKPRVEEAKQKETAEMMGKLKDLGNSILGRFGLSTDNFQFTPNGQGGYGLNFVR